MKVDCSRVTHPFATAFISACASIKTVRLACLNHAASVHSEPGSNSPKRVQNLVIHELLYSASTEVDARCLTEVRAPFLNFDWGSQSIAQIKFQRAFPAVGREMSNFFRAFVKSFSRSCAIIRMRSFWRPLSMRSISGLHFVKIGSDRGSARME